MRALQRSLSFKTSSDAGSDAGNSNDTTPREGGMLSPMRMLRKMASSRFGTTSNSGKNDSDEMAGSGGGGLSLGIGNNKAEGSVKKSKGWNVMRSDVALISRNDLEESLRENLESPVLAVVVKLAHNILDRKHNTAASYSGALLFEWAVSRGFELTAQESVLLAKAHFDVWTNRSLGAEAYNIHRACSLYEGALKSMEEASDAEVWLNYARALQCKGDKSLALTIMKMIVSTFEAHPELPQFLMYTGAICKALGRFDEASTYFFEATMTGPPRYFSKLEMMFIISRNIEEESKINEEPNEDAYEMVHAHLVIEGHVSENISYDDWISSSSTWRHLGDKAAAHGMYSLATDLYGQGIMKDAEAFRKPKLWFGFAKACHRCGRSSDAQLAIKQALTMSPFNSQLLRADQLSSEQTHEFETLIEGDLEAILDNLPTAKEIRDWGANRLQAVHRGNTDRREFKIGVGDQAGNSKKMSARVGVLLGSMHPVLLSARASWMGTVKIITATDIDGNKADFRLKTPFTPIKEIGTPRRLKLFLLARQDETYDRHIITIRFVDQDTEEYLERSMTLSYREHDSEGHVLHMVHKAGQKEDEEIRGAPLEHGPKTKWTMLELLRFKDEHNITTNIVDVEVDRGAFIWKSETLHTSSHLYLYHITNEEGLTLVSISQLSNNRKVTFSMQREHIDRARDMKQAVKMLMEFTEKHPMLTSLMHGVALPETGENDDSTMPAVIEEEVEGTQEGGDSAPTLLWSNRNGGRKGINVKGKLYVVNVFPFHSRGCLVKLFEVNAVPILSASVEVLPVNSISEMMVLPSRQKRLTRENSVRENLLSAGPDNGIAEESDPWYKSMISAKDSIKRDTPVSSGLSDPSSPVHGSPISSPKSTERKKTSSDLSNAQDGSRTPPKAISTSPPASVVEGVDEEAAKDETGTVSPLGSAELPAPASASDEVKLDGISAQSMDEAEPQSLASASAALGEPSLNQVSADEVGYMSEESIGIGYMSEESLGNALPESLEGSDVEGETEGREEEEEEGKEDADEENDGKKKGKKKSKKQLAKERREERKKILAAKLQARTTQAEEDEGDDVVESPEKIREREMKKKAAREKLLAEKNRIEAAAKEKAEKRKAAEEEKKKIQQAQDATPKTAKIRAKKAALAAVNFLEHQSARVSASEYLIERATKAICRCAREEAATYLILRAKNAQVMYNDFLEAAAAAEATAKAEAEAAAAAAAAAAAVAAASGSLRKSMDASKFKKADKKKGGKTKTSTNDSVASDVQTSAGESAEAAVDDFVSKDVNDESGYQEAAISSREREEAVFLEDDKQAEDLFLEAQSFVSSTQDADIRFPPFGDSSIEASSPTSFAEVVVRRGPREHNHAEFHMPNYPIKYVPKKIKMNHKPALSEKQKQKLRQPLDLRDIPSWAFDSAEGLVLALQASSSSLPGVDNNNKLLSRSLDSSLPFDSAYTMSLFRETSMQECSVIWDPKIEMFKQEQSEMLRSRSKSLKSGSKAATLENRPVSPFDPRPRPNPIAFLESKGLVSELDNVVTSAVSFSQQAVQNFKARGYSDGASPYVSHWRQKISDCLEIFATGAVLRKAVSTLQRMTSIKISKVEALCALAETGGSCSESLGRLSDEEFLREVKVVCAMLPIASIASKLLHEDADSLDSPLSSSLASGVARRKAAKLMQETLSSNFRQVMESPLLRDVQGKITNTPTVYERKSEVTPAAPFILGTDQKSSTGASSIRVHDYEASKAYPHLNMEQSSPIVRARGTKLKISGKAEPPKMQPKESGGVFASSMLPPLRDSSSDELLFLQQQHSISGGSYLPLGQSPFNSSTSPMFPEQSDSVGFPQTLASSATKISGLPFRDNSTVAIKPYSKSLRLEQAIDVLYEQAPSSMVVMCRRDAHRAASETILSRSSHKRLKALALKRSKVFRSKLSLTRNQEQEEQEILNPRVLLSSDDEEDKRESVDVKGVSWTD